MNVNFRALIKEPRGFTRILQVCFGMMAWSTIRNFSTISQLEVYCPDSTPYTVDYRIAWPFDLQEQVISSPHNCTDDVSVDPKKFPIDFSTIAMLYVLLCMTSVLYAISCLVYYSVYTTKYESDPLAPMIDLGITSTLLILWIILTVLWALNVSDIKHYTDPHYFKDHLTICQDNSANCQPTNPGKWSSLTVSIVCGFTCVLLWIGSTWFTLKETSIHKGQAFQQTQGQNIPAEPRVQ